MNKITKRIMALMLSLVMMLGCIPSFVNVTNAAMLYSILQTAESGCPSSVDDAWINENGYKCYGNDAYIRFYNANNEKKKSLMSSDSYLLTGDDYYPEYFDGIIIHMINGKAVSIEVTGEVEYAGLYKPKEKTPISEVNIISSGVLATNIQTLKYEAEEEEDAPYILSDVPTSSWYQEEELTNAYDLTATGDAYKKLVLSPKSGYKFDEYATISLNGTGTIWGDGTLNDDGTLTVVIKATVEDIFTKSATITLPTVPGTTVDQIKNNITVTTTATAGIATIDTTNFNLYYVDDIDFINPIDEPLEEGKEYIVKFYVKDNENKCYTSVQVNGTDLDDLGFLLYVPKTVNVFYKPMGPAVGINYKFKSQQPSSGGSSKKYKAIDDKKTTEKITGTGKKGSKRTIIPEPNRKVLSVIVTDKDGNKYEVTNEGDGTYSFIQPGTNVDVEVKYKNRLIELTIGSLDASVDDVHHNLDVVPKVVNDRTMLPIRFVAENLGAKVDWDEKDPNTVIITRENTKIVITLGSDKAYVNGEEYILDSVAFAENDRTYLPVRFVSEKLNAIVEWNEAHPMDVKIYERQ